MRPHGWQCSRITAPRRSTGSELQQKEFAAAARGFTAVKHQREVGVGYFDGVASVIAGGESATLAMHGSTEAEQFPEAPAPRPMVAGEMTAAR